MAPCSESSSGRVNNSPHRNPDRAGDLSPMDYNPDIKSADAALQRINRANGRPTCTRDDVFDCFERIHRATEHLVDGVEYERDQDVRSEPELYSHTRSREQMQDDSDLMAMINVSEDILRTLRYVQDNNTNRQQQQEHQRRLLQGTNHRHHRGSSEHLSEPVSPRESIARGQKRKKEQEQQEQQQQQGVSHKQKSPRAQPQPAYCRQCKCTGTVKWRSGPEGLKTLCNVCGLLYAKRLRRFQML